MSQPPQPPWPPQPPGPGEPPQPPGGPFPQPGAGPPRFSGGGVAVGAALYLPAALMISVTANAVAGLFGDLGSATTIALALAGLLPIAVGIGVAARGSTPWLRGFGLGLALGWAVWGVVGGGICVGILALLGATGGLS